MAVAEVWEVSKRAIESYTGLSPATFFTVLAVAVALYYTIAGFLAPPPPPPPRQEVVDPLPPPVQLGEVTEEELRAYDGSDPKKPLLMAIKGQIYDVTQSRMFYGPGGPYALFAGKDASRALAKMSFEQNDLTGDISGLGPFELEALQDWEYKFTGKYTKVGTIKKTVPETEGSNDSTSSITEKSLEATDDSDERDGHGAETKEDGQAETSTNVEHSEESKEDGAGRGDESEHAELKGEGAKE
ncbi:membrane steroid-binding protein [Musa troglodytarum]|uniref:Membrane steroid-binding protein n=1 Tax=Musa troglodytarum TaxID=320322 RepID=A0A9E7EP43_9LILI|nr:membrane steroid-binding protein [Musa troglodytarum]